MSYWGGGRYDSRGVLQKRKKIMERKTSKDNHGAYKKYWYNGFQPYRHNRETRDKVMNGERERERENMQIYTESVRASQPPLSGKRLLASLLLDGSARSELGGCDPLRRALAALGARTPDAAAVFESGLDLVLVTFDRVTARKLGAAALARGLAEGAVPGVAEQSCTQTIETAFDDGTGLLFVVVMVNVALHLGEAGKDLLAALAVDGALVGALARGGVFDETTTSAGAEANGLISRVGARVGGVRRSGWWVS
jgi:hypothetical protein